MQGLSGNTVGREWSGVAARPLPSGARDSRVHTTAAAGAAGVGGAPSWDPFQMVGGITPPAAPVPAPAAPAPVAAARLTDPVSPPDGRCGSSAGDASLVSQGGYFMDENGISRGQQRQARARLQQLPGPHLDGLMRNPSHSSNGSDPIGMYMNFDSPKRFGSPQTGATLGVPVGARPEPRAAAASARCLHGGPAHI